VSTIEVLCEISRVANQQRRRKGKLVKDQNFPSEQLTLLRDLCFATLRDFCHEMHGNIESTITVLLKNLLPNISLSFVRVSGTTVPKECIVIRDRTLSFLDDLLGQAEHTAELVATSLQVMLQHLCMKVPERAEYRHSAQEVISHILSKLKSDSRLRFIRFIEKYSKNKKVAFRLFAVEISIHLILDSLTKITSDENFSMEFRPLLSILMQRSSDRSVHVRAKSLTCIASLLSRFNDSPEQLRNQIMEIFFVKDHTQSKSPTMQTNTQSKVPTTPRTPNTLTTDTPQRSTDLSMTKECVIDILRRRVNDEKATVRKAAIQALETIAYCRIPNVELTANDLRLFQERCFDRSLAIRKQSLISLSELFKQNPSSIQLCRIWLTSVLPLILDPEVSVVETCLAYFHELVIERIVHSSNDGDSIWMLLIEIEKHAPEISKFLQRFCILLGKEKKLSKKLIVSLETAITKWKLTAAWTLLSHIAPYCANYLNYSFVVERWNEIQNKRNANEEAENELCNILRVIACIHKNIPNDIVSRICEAIFEELKRFERSPQLIQNYIQTLAKLSPVTKSTHNSWATALMSECETVLSAVVLPSAGVIGDEKSQHAKISSITTGKLEKYLFTLGEVAQICPRGLSKKLTTVIQTILSPTLEKLTLRYDSTDTVEARPIPPSVRAHGYVTLGKLCLEDSQLAKQCIAMFAKDLLTPQQHPIIRNNIMIIMCDLCVRYPTLVDAYIPNLTMCLRDDNELVRKQTLLLLTQLIQEDYIKWKNGALFFRFIVSLVDESPDVRQYAIHCLSSLLDKNKGTNNIFFTHFIETLFCLNDYRLHGTYNQFPQTERERLLFSLKGNDNKEKRMTIYKLFLENLTDDQKFSLQSKLCQEILAGVIEGKLDLQQAYFVLQDAITILLSKEIKVCHSTVQNKDEDDVVEETIENLPDANSAAATQKLADAKCKILSKIVKKNVMENIVPIVIELKKLLEKHRSPLLGDLMLFLKELIKDYRDEMNEVLFDKQLIKELEYELQHEKDQKTMTPSTTKLTTPSAHATFSTPKGAPRETIDHSNLSVPKLRRRVSMASQSYTPSSGKKKIKSVLSTNNDTDEDNDNVHDKDKGFTQNQIEVGSSNVIDDQTSECDSKNRKKKNESRIPGTPATSREADICLPSLCKPQLWTTVSDTPPPRIGKKSSKKKETMDSEANEVVANNEDDEENSKPNRKSKRKRHTAQSKSPSPVRKQIKSRHSTRSKEDETQNRENSENAKTTESTKQSKRKRVEQSHTECSDVSAQQKPPHSTRRTLRSQHIK